jgi:NADH:ubiquinone oxidoreductase subunit 5 (subunit L)/multisubunit Na+/H+ antiporter MnhA subunit
MHIIKWIQLDKLYTDQHCYFLSSGFKSVTMSYITSTLFIVNYTTPTGVFDTLTAVMCLVVTLVSCLVVLFSFSYMIQDPHFIRFISYLKLFTVAMLVLVTADNMIQLFVGWEGVGLASFLLISFGIHVYKRVKLLFKL